jgi:phospholipase/lecithinase/hemolysin
MINAFIKYTTSLFLSLFFTVSLAIAGAGTEIHRIVFFGDSLSDNGNLFSATWKYMPKLPPYFDGRFSNGEVWAEAMARYFDETHAVTSVNYAYGGQTAIFHNPVKGYLPYTLSLAVDSYLLHSSFAERANTLFVIWIGGNDYLPGSTQIELLSVSVTNKIKDIIASLIYHGGKNFLVLNLPDLGRMPYANDMQISDMLTAATQMHNEKLRYAIDDLQENYLEENIQLFDLASLFSAVLDNVEMFNKKYHINITNVVNSCWHGGYTVRGVDAPQKAIAGDLQRFLQHDKKTLDALSDSTQASVAKYITESPALLEAYSFSKSALPQAVCDNPDEYVFWDRVHPTRIVHRLLANVVIDYVKDNYRYDMEFKK